MLAMIVLRRILLVGVVLVALAAAWLWWNRPQPADMAAYVPADAIIYIEANSLTEIATGITSTDAWRALAPAAGIKTDFGRVGWWSRFAAWTGFGPADSVVLARAQVAVAVLSFDAAEEASETLKIIPRVALVAETHTSESRVRAALEKLVGDFARRTYGSPRVETSQTDDTFYMTWTAPSDERRKIVAAVTESFAVVGNDRSAVEACLAARRGERPALSADAQLEEMRARMDARSALAFGYVPAGNAAKLLEVTALAYAGQMSVNPRTQSFIASLLPPLANKLLGSAGWSTRVRQGAVEDNYFVTLQSGLAPRLAEALAPANDATADAVQFLPADAYQLTRYNYSEPETTWRGFNAALSTQLDTLSAPFAARFLEEALKPYGIESPREFLRAAGPELATARLDDSGDSTVLVVGVRDREAMQTEVRKRLGAGARTVAVGAETLIVSTDEERGAASFVGDYLLMGRVEDLRRCLEARALARTLATTESIKQTPRNLFDAPPSGVFTLTDDEEPAQAFVSYFAPQGSQQNGRADALELRRVLPRRAYAATESRFIADGFERRTRSSFGNFGTLVTRFAPQR
ncbi:MAG TPA: hypothetical protein VNA19_16175 [Pyrinomonadaceae bacterium]|nr:hypothetical protein [Pyrinomonadaceae bacterium]